VVGALRLEGQLLISPFTLELIFGLIALGVEKVVKEGKNSSVQLPEELYAILELVGNSTIIDS
jgi:hypothetical protein